MFDDIVEELRKYLQEGETVALAQVVWRQAPSSGKPGDKAIIRSNGSITGWIGGGCVKSIALKEGLKAIEEQKHRLVKIAPEYSESDDADNSSESLKTYKMTCHSGGSLDIFIEPIMPKPHIIILGKSNISSALSKISKATGYKVTVMSPGIEKDMFPESDQLIEKLDFESIRITPNTYIIVSTQGDNDEEALRLSLLTGCQYVGFVASPKKSEGVKSYLKSSGLDETMVESLKTPVGIDIKAKVPEEVAISILAEIIQDFRSEKWATGESGQSESGPGSGPTLSNEYFLNPVCNLPISKSDSKHIVDYKGHKIYFCCDGCKVSWDKSTDHYFAIMEKAGEKQ